jgi:cytochrome c oxidase subunit IV
VSDKVVARKTYVIVWAVLLAFTFVTWGVAYIDLGPFNIVVALVIALTKASLVVLVFMHMLYTRHRTQLVLVAGLFWLLLLFMTLADYLTRAPQPLETRNFGGRHSSLVNSRSFRCAQEDIIFVE